MYQIRVFRVIFIEEFAFNKPAIATNIFLMTEIRFLKDLI
jgi:hypothetical protein